MIHMLYILVGFLTICAALFVLFVLIYMGETKWQGRPLLEWAFWLFILLVLSWMIGMIVMGVTP